MVVVGDSIDCPGAGVDGVPGTGLVAPGCESGSKPGVGSPSSLKGKGAAIEEVYVPFDRLEEGVSVAVKAMVCRKWDVNNSYGKYLSTDYVLSDDEGNSIHCSAMNNIAHRFVCKLTEGSVFCLKNFSVLPNREKYRVRRSDPHLISLEGYTVVKKLDCPIDCFVRFPFDLIPLEDVQMNDSSFLIDVIGYVSNMGPLKTTTGGSELVEFELMNERHTRMRVTLWAPLCNEMLKRKSGSLSPYIVILPSMNIKEFRGEPYLSNTSATIIFDAPDIPQIDELLSLLKKCDIAAVASKPPPPAFTVGSVYQLLQAGRNQKDVRKKSCTFHCKITVVDVKTKDGWFYFSCGLGGCKKRVHRSGSKFMCQACTKVSEFPRTSFRLHLTVADSTGTVVVTMFDDVAAKLIGKSAAQLLDACDDDGEESVLPASILSLINTSLVLEIKSHTYYVQGAYESFTVSTVVGRAGAQVCPQKRSRTDSGDEVIVEDDALRGFPRGNDVVDEAHSSDPSLSID